MKQLQAENMIVPSSETFDKLGIKFPEVLSKLPDEIFLFWKPLLEALDQASSEFIPLLSVTLLCDLVACDNDASNVTDFVPFALLSWLQNIMKACSHNAEKDQFVFCCDMPWLTLLEMCLKQPSKSMHYLVLTILPNLGSQNNFKQKIIDLLQIFLQEPSSHETENNIRYVSETTENLLTPLIEDMRTKQNKPAIVTTATQCSSWTPAFGCTQWQTIPLGEILGADTGETSLDLEKSLSFSFNEKAADVHSLQPEFDELDKISQTCESETGQITQYYSCCSETEEGNMIVDENHSELESNHNEPHFQSEIDVQQIQNAICLF